VEGVAAYHFGEAQPRERGTRRQGQSPARELGLVLQVPHRVAQVLHRTVEGVAAYLLGEAQPRERGTRRQGQSPARELGLVLQVPHRVAQVLHRRRARRTTCKRDEHTVLNIQQGFQYGPQIPQAGSPPGVGGPATHTAARHVPAAASATGAPSSATTAVCSPDAVNSRSRCAEVATATWLPATASEHAASPAAAGLG
jgi:hypothetical protein